MKLQIPETTVFVDAAWVRDNRDHVHLFDSRKYLDGRSGAAEFEQGHVPGAFFVDLDADLAAPAAQPGGRHPFPTEEHFAAAMSRLGYDASTVAVIYDDVGGAMAGRLWFMLRLIGCAAVILDGGIQAWDGELESGPAGDVAPAAFTPRPWPTNRLVSADEVARRIAAGGVVMDARNHSRYVGKQNRIDPRFGHIPGAISRPWEDNIDDLTGQLLAPGQLAERYGAVIEAGTGPRPVAYCGSGVTACHNLAVLTTLGVEADLYVGSWSEWGADENRPLATGAATESG